MKYQISTFVVFQLSIFTRHVLPLKLLVLLSEMESVCLCELVRLGVKVKYLHDNGRPTDDRHTECSYCSWRLREIRGVTLGTKKGHCWSEYGFALFRTRAGKVAYSTFAILEVVSFWKCDNFYCIYLSFFVCFLTLSLNIKELLIGWMCHGGKGRSTGGWRLKVVVLVIQLWFPLQR